MCGMLCLCFNSEDFFFTLLYVLLIDAVICKFIFKYCLKYFQIIKKEIKQEHITTALNKNLLF